MEFYTSPLILKRLMLGSPYNKHGRVEKCIQNFWWEHLKARDNLEGVELGERIILEWILEK